MNYLGHFHLAAPSADLIVGNLLGEYVHGKSSESNYPSSVWEGIMMHRHIDSYTDAHPASRALAEFFRADFKRYAPVMSDIALDYFLASDRARYPERKDLQAFASNIYTTLENQLPIFPTRAQQVVLDMKKYNWLTQYRQFEGIGKAFAHIISRSTYLDPKPSPFRAIKILQENDSEMRKLYNILLNDMEKEF